MQKITENQDKIYITKQRYDFTIVDNDILRDRREGIKAQTRLIYWVLNFFTDQKGVECFPSMETIAKTAGVSKTTVIEALKTLEKYEFISKEKLRRENKDFFYNKYTILIKDKNIKT